MTPQQFIAKWQRAELTERSACQQHFLDLCDLLGVKVAPAAQLAPIDTAANLIARFSLPFVIKLAHKGLAAFDDDPHLAAGLNVRGGRIMHKAVAASLGFDGAPAGNVRLVAAE